MIDYGKIWSSINSESKVNYDRPLIARKVPSNGPYAAFLATDFRKGHRMLYLRLYSSSEISSDELPKFKGLEISIVQSTIGEFHDESFLKFRQTLINTDIVFESVIADICNRAIQVQNNSQLEATLKKALSEWKVFFEKQSIEIMSMSQQKGLIGELHFLKNYLFKKYTYSEAVSFWTGCDRANHDFQINDIAVEIKATSSKQHKKFYVSSEKQLDDAGLKRLYLAGLSLSLHANRLDKCLPSLINEMLFVIQNDSVASYHFQLKLLKYGYLNGHSDRYTTGFSVINENFFEVREGFPRLLPVQVPNGVGDLRYTVMIDSCMPFKLNTDILKAI